MIEEFDVTTLTANLEGDKKRIYLARQADIDETLELWHKDCQRYLAEGITLAKVGGNFPVSLKECLDFCIEISIEDECYEEQLCQYWAEFL